jgi:hypothetical protein
MASIRAEIRLSGKNSPVTHVGFLSRKVKKGEVFVTLNPKEISYYRNQQGFTVSIKEGRLAAAPRKPKKAPPAPEPEEDEDEDEDEESDEEESEDEESDEEESDDDDDEEGGYLENDLKKLKVADLKALVKDDDDLPLTLKELPRKAGKKEIIDLILEAQEED